MNKMWNLLEDFVSKCQIFRVFTISAAIILGIITFITHNGVWATILVFALGLFSFLEGVHREGI